MKGRSTCTNLLKFVNLSVSKIEEGDVIYTDISKAFDRLSHTALVGKLSRIGVKSNSGINLVLP